MKVRFTARAWQDLNEIFDYIARDSKPYARKTVWS
jgi:plasmid stabilization system protein ParE